MLSVNECGDVVDKLYKLLFLDKSIPAAGARTKQPGKTIRTDGWGINPIDGRVVGCTGAAKAGCSRSGR